MSEEKKFSIAALSQTLPERLIEQVTPLLAMSILVNQPLNAVQAIILECPTLRRATHQ